MKLHISIADCNFYYCLAGLKLERVNFWLRSPTSQLADQWARGVSISYPPWSFYLGVDAFVRNRNTTALGTS